MERHLLVLILLSLGFAPAAFSLTEGARTLVDFETQANAAAHRSSEPVRMPHFEIPADLVGGDISERFPKEYLKHLLFKKDGQVYLRWILNPEDTEWSHKIVTYFKAKGLDLKKHYYFTGYQTASRSYIVEDPLKQIQFSVKSSTNVTGGQWASKQQPVGEALDSRLNADLIKNIESQLAFKNFVFLDEPAVFTLPGVDQAVVIRDLGALNNAKKEFFYVPGFSVLHDQVGERIAIMNGSTNPKEFWREHYIRPVGRALGEFAARTGMQFDSPHSQNFLVEMTGKYKPTGRIIFRDLADLFIYRKATEALHRTPEKYFNLFSQKENVNNFIAAGFGPLHGNSFPKWLNMNVYNDWMKDFFMEFEQTFVKESGIPLAQVKAADGVRNSNYYSNSYTIPTGTPETRAFWYNMHKYQSPLGILNCSAVFL